MRPTNDPSALTSPSDVRAAAPLWPRLRDALEICNTPFRHVQDALRFPRSEARATKRLRAQLTRGTPIVVYSATKTASTAVAAALVRSGGIEVAKVHMLQPEHFWAGPLTSPVAPDGLLRHRAIEQRTVRRELLLSTCPVRVVSVSRDPIAFNLSNYTYFGRAYWMRSFWRSAPWWPTERLMDHFLRTFPHESSSVWWQREFAVTTGIDPLAEGFDDARGWQRYQRGRFDCLVIRGELSDDAKSQALSAWIGRDVSAVQRENANDRQAAPGVYERLKRAMCAQPEYVRRMLALPAVRVLMGTTERARLESLWLHPKGNGRQ